MKFRSASSLKLNLEDLKKNINLCNTFDKNNLFRSQEVFYPQYKTTRKPTKSTIYSPKRSIDNFHDSDKRYLATTTNRFYFKTPESNLQIKLSTIQPDSSNRDIKLPSKQNENFTYKLLRKKSKQGMFSTTSLNYFTTTKKPKKTSFVDEGAQAEIKIDNYQNNNLIREQVFKSISGMNSLRQKSEDLKSPKATKNETQLTFNKNHQKKTSIDKTLKNNVSENQFFVKQNNKILKTYSTEKKSTEFEKSQNLNIETDNLALENDENLTKFSALKKGLATYCTNLPNPRASSIKQYPDQSVDRLSKMMKFKKHNSLPKLIETQSKYQDDLRDTISNVFISKIVEILHEPDSQIDDIKSQSVNDKKIKTIIKSEVEEKFTQFKFKNFSSIKPDFKSENLRNSSKRKIFIKSNRDLNSSNEKGNFNVRNLQDSLRSISRRKDLSSLKNILDEKIQNRSSRIIKHI